jgi:hypothetical protein
LPFFSFFSSLSKGMQMKKNISLIFFIFLPYVEKKYALCKNIKLK